MSTKQRIQTQPVQEQEYDAVHRRIDRIERLIQSLGLLGGGLGIGGLGSGGGVQNCGLTISPDHFNVTIPTNDTGSVAAVFTVTSSVAQTVTFTASYIGAPPACLGSLVVLPSTVTFTAGQSALVAIMVPYANCSTAGVSVHIALSATTSLGCTASNLLTGTGGGLATTSDAGTFALEASCNNVSGCCGAQAGIWGAVATTTAGLCGAYINCGLCVPPLPDSCPGNCQAAGAGGAFNLRVRSINGFAGTIILTCGSDTTTDCTGGTYDGCSGFPASITLTAGQILGIGASYWWAYVQLYGNRQGHVQTSSNGQIVVQGTSGSITKTTMGQTSLIYVMCA